jgi:hypothetical protein
MRVSVVDAVTLDGDMRETKDGYLVTSARIARTGVQIYSGAEMERPGVEQVRVLRQDTEVFAPDSLASFAHKPITIDHPSHLVTAESWRDDAVGYGGGEVARDGDFIRVPLMLADATVIKAVRDGKRELSCGYTCEIDWTPGETPSGEKYDARQVSISGNHVAVVERGRAGAACRVGDSWTETSTKRGLDMPETALRTVTVDGLSITTTDQGAQMIERLQTQLRDAAAALSTKDGEAAAVKAKHVSALTAKDGEIAALQETHRSDMAAKDGEIVALKTKIPDAAAIDRMMVERGAVIDAAVKIIGASYDPKGKSISDVRRDAVCKRLGESMVADKEDAWVDAAFTTLTAVSPGASMPRDPLRDALRAPVKQTTDAKSAYDEMTAHLEKSWKRPTINDRSAA